MKKHYSGSKSRKFWKQIDSLADADQQELYSLGVCLQTLEEYVLKALKNAKK